MTEGAEEITPPPGRGKIYTIVRLGYFDTVYMATISNMKGCHLAKKWRTKMLVKCYYVYGTGTRNNK